MAIATSRCTQATAIIFLRSLRERRARKRGCIAGGYPEDMPIPARSIPTRTGAKSLSTGTSTELDTHGQEAALLAPTLIREDRTPPGKCCGSSSSIRFHKSQERVSPSAAMSAVPLACQAMSGRVYESKRGSQESNKSFRAMSGLSNGGTVQSSGYSAEIFSTGRGSRPS
jgi:hypothetical protein